MNKIAISIFGLILSSATQAGSMGKVETPPKFSPYFNLEASATWNGQGVYRVNSALATQTNNIWGGRFSAGNVWRYNSFGLIGEVGGGYYGKTDNRNPLGGVVVNRKFDGYDILVGVIYNLAKYISVNLDVFGDVGFMGQNMRYERIYNYSSFVSGGFIIGSNTEKMIRTAILPEFKVGVIYNYNDSLGLTVTYLHVFGTEPDGSITIQGVPGSSLNINGSQTYANPTFDTLLFGIRYYFS